MTDINLEYRCNHDDCRKGKGLFITVERWKARLPNLDKTASDTLALVIVVGGAGWDAAQSAEQR